MRFLLRIEATLPPDLPESKRNEVLEAELERGVELRRAGTIEAIWRLPGRLANVAIWNATDATELHEMIASLPLFPWLEVEVTPLAEHPVERVLRERRARTAAEGTSASA